MFSKVENATKNRKTGAETFFLSRGFFTSKVLFLPLRIISLLTEKSCLLMDFRVLRICASLRKNEDASWFHVGYTRFPFKLSNSVARHRDLNIHIETACQLHGEKMTRHGLLHEGFNISLLCFMGMNIGFFWLLKNSLYWWVRLSNVILHACI